MELELVTPKNAIWGCTGVLWAAVALLPLPDALAIVIAGTAAFATCAPVLSKTCSDIWYGPELGDDGVQLNSTGVVPDLGTLTPVCAAWFVVALAGSTNWTLNPETSWSALPLWT